jgi:hypothetical protein
MEYPYLHVISEDQASLLDDVDLTPTVAESIRSFPGRLSIDDVNMLPPEFVATLLDGYAGSGLSISGHQYLTPEAAKAISALQADLSLGGNFSLTPEVAEYLSNVKGNLYISDAEKLSAEAAAHLANHTGGSLGLNGVETLSDEAADALSKHQGSLELNSLAEISEAGCLELAKHRECIDMESLDPETLTPAALEAFKTAWPDVWGNV